jgi:sec-independent protein translocase protein TatB
MFDISWTEFLLIGVVALIVIGPKELPAVLRTVGQWTRKVRGMAADFQSQFQEAMREAEMADLKKEVDDLTTDIRRYDPLKEVRAEFEAAGQDIRNSLEQKPDAAADVAAPAGAAVSAGNGMAPTPPDLLGADRTDGAVGPAAGEESDSQLALPLAGAETGAAGVTAATTGSAAPQAAEVPASPDSTRHGG